MTGTARRLSSALLLLVAAAAARGDTAPAPYGATVTFLKGIARVQALGRKEYANLALGKTLAEGDTVVTLDNARLELKLENGTVIRLGANSNFVLQTLQRTASGGVKGIFRAAKGRLWFTVAKLTGDSELRTQTPTVVAAVKGTVWRADVGATGKTDLVVYDGVVSAQRDGQPAVDIGKMEKLAALPNAAFERSSYDESQDDRDDWARWNKSRDKLRVMIVLPEKRGDERSLTSVSETAAINRFLGNYLFKVVEKEQVDRIREGEKLKAALKGDNAAAAAAGLEVAADLIIVGEAVARYFKSPALGGLVSATANLTARAVRSDTAEIIAANPAVQARAVDITDEAAASKALVAAGERTASEFVDAILAKWRREIRRGTGLDVTVDNADFRRVKTVTNGLAKLEGVKDVQMLYLVGRRALLNVTTAGDAASLAEAVADASFGGLTVAVVGLSGYKVELEIQGRAPAAKAPPAAPAEPASTTFVPAGPAASATMTSAPATGATR